MADAVSQPLIVGEILVDVEARAVWVRGSEVHLTRTEFNLLQVLAENSGRVLSKESLLQQVWDYSYVGDTRVIPVHIGNLRRKLAQAGAGEYIRSLRGVGYKLEAPGPIVPRVPSQAPGRTRPPSRPPDGGRTPSAFVGRDQQLNRLERLYHQVVQQGRGAAVLVSGEPGVGKTRLAEELSARSINEDATVVWGRSVEDEGAPPYWPWAVMVRRWLESAPESASTDVARSRARDLTWLDAGRTAPEDVVPPAVDPATRFRMFEDTVSFLHAAAAYRPLVLVFDDLQDADRASLDLLEHVCRELPHLRLLLIATYRAFEMSGGHPLSRVLATAAREFPDCLLKLEGLTRDEVATLVRAVTERETPAGLIDTVTAYTEGNPFLVLQTVRLLLETGGIDRPEQLIETIQVPESVHAMVLRRLDTLGAECRMVLDVAAVAGREFSLETVGRVTKLSGHALVDAIDRAIGDRLIQALPGDQAFRFHHDLTREAIYHELGVARRMRLHGEIGDAVESAYATRLTDHLEELARHYRGAAPLGWADKAVKYSLAAGQAALSRYAWDDARAHFVRALDLSAHLEEPGREAAEAECWSALGDVAVAGQQYDEAREAYATALQLMSAAEGFRRSRVRRKVAKTFLDQLALPPAIEALEAAAGELGGLDRTSDAESWQEWLDARLEMLWACYYAGDMARLERLLAETGPDILRRGTPLQELGFLRCRLLFELSSRGHWSTPESVELADRMLEAAYATGIPAEEALSEAMVASILISRPGVDEAGLAETDQHSVAALRLGEQSGDMHSQMLALSHRATAARLRHDVGAARRWGEICMNRPLPGEWQAYVAFGEAHVAWADWCEGHTDRAREQAESAVARWKASNPFMPYAWMARLVILAAAAERRELHEALEQARALLDPIKQTPPPPLAAALEELLRVAEETAANGEPSPSRHGRSDAPTPAIAALDRAVSAAQECGWL